MNNPQFYIFGVPEGFDIYNATPEKRDFFLSFYDGKYTSRSIMMVIYRSKDNNEVTYVYFRGNILAANGRPGSFLGMALTFQSGMYCTDVKLVHDLFEGMYIAISNNRLLTTDVDNNQYQARYLVTKFVEQTSNIAALEQFVADQIDKWPKGSLAFTDNTFSNDPRSIELDLSNISWDHVIPNMKAVSWVYLTGLTLNSLEPTPPLVDYSESIRKYEETFRQICSRFDSTQNDFNKRKERLNNLLGEVTKLNNVWTSNDGRSLQQKIEKELSLLPPPSTPVPPPSYGERLKRLASDFSFELDGRRGNNLKSLQLRLGMMRSLKERAKKLIMERPDEKKAQDLSNQIDEEIKHIIVQINTIKKRNKLTALIIAIVVVVLFAAIFISKCSNTPGTKPDPDPKKDELKTKIEEKRNTVDSLQNSLDTVQEKLKTLENFKNAKEAILNANNLLDDAEDKLDKDDTSYYSVVDNDLTRTGTYITKAKKFIEQFNRERQQIKKESKQPKLVQDESADKKKSDNKSNKKENEKKDETKWSWKITGDNIGTKWSETELHIPSATHITITVYNNGKETPVVWDWSGATMIQTQEVKAKTTELSSIKITRDNVQTNGVICFYPKGQSEQKQTIKIKPE